MLRTVCAVRSSPERETVKGREESPPFEMEGDGGDGSRFDGFEAVDDGDELDELDLDVEFEKLEADDIDLDELDDDLDFEEPDFEDIDLGFEDELDPEEGRPSTPLFGGDEATFEGGDGTSMEDAVRIEDVAGKMALISAEKRFVSEQLGPEREAWTLRSQALVLGDDGRSYDELTVETSDGETETFYFDLGEDGP